MKWQVDALTKGREVVRRRAPYFAAGVYRFKPVRVEELGTLVVDSSRRLYYDPEALKEWELPMVASVLVHELLHLLDRHPERAQAAGVRTAVDAGYWNIAADLALYVLMRAGKWETAGHLRPSMFGLPARRTVEEYYRLLRELEEPPELPPSDAPLPGRGNCGSCATGWRSPWEHPAEPPETERVERELLRRAVSQAMEAHAKARGALPAGYQVMIDDALKKPQIPWQRVLAGTVKAHSYAPGKVDYSRARPSRRQASTPDFIRPALVRPTPRVAVVLDTSGSMDRDDLVEALSEIKGILRACGVTDGVTVLPCDAVVHEVQQVWHPRQIHITGRGGTRMGEGLREATLLVPPPSVVCVLTDGHTNWPEERPTRCPVVVLLVGKGKARLESVPKWARGLETKYGEETEV